MGFLRRGAAGICKCGHAHDHGVHSERREAAVLKHDRLKEEPDEYSREGEVAQYRAEQSVEHEMDAHWRHWNVYP